MTPEQRLDRVERILGTLATSGRKARSEFREKINILINMQMRHGEEWRAESRALDERISILIDAQIRNEAAWRAEANTVNEQIKAVDEQIKAVDEQVKAVAVAQAELTKSQKLTDRALRAFINSHRKRENGDSST
jgi:hypothetical protein